MKIHIVGAILWTLGTLGVLVIGLQVAQAIGYVQ